MPFRRLSKLEIALNGTLEDGSDIDTKYIAINSAELAQVTSRSLTLVMSVSIRYAAPAVVAVLDPSTKQQVQLENRLSIVSNCFGSVVVRFDLDFKSQITLLGWWFHFE